MNPRSALYQLLISLSLSSSHQLDTILKPTLEGVLRLHELVLLKQVLTLGVWVAALVTKGAISIEWWGEKRLSSDQVKGSLSLHWIYCMHYRELKPAGHSRGYNNKQTKVQPCGPYIPEMRNEYLSKTHSMTDGCSGGQSKKWDWEGLGLEWEFSSGWSGKT